MVITPFKAQTTKIEVIRNDVTIKSKGIGKSVSTSIRTSITVHIGRITSKGYGRK